MNELMRFFGQVGAPQLRQIRFRSRAPERIRVLVVR